MTSIIIAIIGLALTVLGLVYRISAFSTEQRLFVKELRKEMHVLKRVPMLEFRLGYVEKHLDLSVPAMPDNGESRDS